MCKIFFHVIWEEKIYHKVDFFIQIDKIKMNIKIETMLALLVLEEFLDKKF